MKNNHEYITQLKKYGLPADVLNVNSFPIKQNTTQKTNHLYSKISRANWNNFIMPFKKII
ncbi:hypothetical protein [Tenacibaculum agarivorans]|uniref:hypothetical protein n=1 Tax=Tenacibaculum agarivorans TaxID=1908389 RepID=UPI00094BA681|nr:hypothetical protein [Tenacibaculum agarivorans]